LVICHFYHGSAMKKTVQSSVTGEETQARVLLEVCISSLKDALAAADGGADRLELNSALELGGLTPSLGLVTDVLQATNLPVISMIRPRGAGFCYDAGERRVMLRDAESLLGLGVAGIAFGALTSDGEIDRRFCRDLVRLAGGRQTVFHRAIDMVPDVQAAIQHLVDLEITRLLTSGQAVTAMEGADLIRSMGQWSAGCLQVLPGAGVDAANVKQLLRQTNCNQVHGSFSRPCNDNAGIVAASTYRETDRARVSAVRRVLDTI
jgi:copper homeostasis protein